MSVSDEVVNSVVKQLKVTSDRLKRQVEDLRRVRVLLESVAAACDRVGLEVPELEQAAQVVALAAAEVEQSVGSWRRAIHRMFADTQPIDVRK